LRFRPLTALLLFIAIPLIADTGGGASDPDPRFPIAQQKEGWGFIDKTGKIVIPCQFADVHNFHDGLAPVLVKRKWGYIDTAGKTIIEPRFVAAEPFHEGLAAVRIHDIDSLIQDPYGYIDTTGKLVIPAKYSFAAPFSSGLARVNFENKLIFIDKSGNPLPFPEGIKKVYADFSEGLAPVGDNRTSATGYIDPAGKLVIPMQPGLGAPFHEGLAAAITSTGKFPHAEKLLSFIDPTGKTVVQTEFSPNTTIDDPTHFSDGLCRVVHYNRKTSPNMRYLYLDKTGKIALELNIPQLRESFDFHEGRARVQIGGNPNSGAGGKFGFIDKTGKLVIPADYDHAEDFRNGLAQLATEDGVLYIDPTGKTIYPAATTVKDH
jgi:hypothetical protein